MSLDELLHSYFVSSQGNTWIYTLAADFPAFNGHFPGNPLLPGVCQLGLCADACSRWQKRRVEIAGVSRCKFSKPILPNTTLKIVLSERPDGQIRAELLSATDESKFSQIVFSVKESV